MIDIYIVEYQCSDMSDFVAFPVRAFKSEQKAEDFVEECKKECERIDLELKEYWDKYLVEYYGLAEVIKQRVMESLRLDTKSKEFKRKEKISAGERKIIASHKCHDSPYRTKKEFYYNIDVVQLDEDE